MKIQHKIPLKLIKEILEEKLGEIEGEKNENIEKLLDYIREKLFFVVLETDATLSETLKIFDTINSTGLDLNGADMFKIRFYEYLSDKKYRKGNRKEREAPYVVGMFVGIGYIPHTW